MTHLLEEGTGGDARRRAARSAYSNGWYIRKKGTQTWTKVGQSTAREHDFGIRLETTDLENGSYQVLGFMSATVRTKERDGSSRDRTSPISKSGTVD